MCLNGTAARVHLLAAFAAAEFVQFEVIMTTFGWSRSWSHHLWCCVKTNLVLIKMLPENMLFQELTTLKSQLTHFARTPPSTNHSTILFYPTHSTVCH